MSRVRAVAASFTDQDAANELVSSLEQSHRVIVSKKITNMVAIKFRVKCFNGSIKVQTITQPNSQFVDPSKLDDLEKMKKEYQSRVASVDSQLRSAQQGKLAAAAHSLSYKHPREMKYKHIASSDRVQTEREEEAESFVCTTLLVLASRQIPDQVH